MDNLTGREISALDSMCPSARRAGLGTRLNEVGSKVRTDTSGVEGLLLTDRTTGATIRLTIDNGVIDTEAGTMSDAGVWTPA